MNINENINLWGTTFLDQMVPGVVHLEKLVPSRFSSLIGVFIQM